MSAKVRTEVSVNGWYFPTMPGLVFHSGKFWFNGNEVKKIYNNGSLAILISGKKHGLKKLRSHATPCKITLNDAPPF